MATQIKKVLAGPLTAKAEEPAAVSFVAGDAVLGQVKIESLPGMTEKLYKQIVGACPMLVRLAIHGISQKGGDSYAGAANEPDPMAYAAASIKETLEGIMANVWRVTSAGGARVTLLARALARVTGNTPEAAQGVVDLHSERDDEGKPSEKGAAWLKAIRARGDIKKASADIKEEDAKAAKAKLAGVEMPTDAADLAGLFTS
jgi:hypothetical protein